MMLTREQIENIRIALQTHHPTIRSATDKEINALCDIALSALAQQEGMVMVPRETFDQWMDRTRPVWRKWKNYQRGLYGSMQCADVMREAWDAAMLAAAPPAEKDGA